MTDLIPAAPGWYLKTNDDPALEPIIAWSPSTGSDGDPILLPYIVNGPGMPPSLIPRDSYEGSGWHAVYRPNHDSDAPDLYQLNQDARAIWQAGATQYDVLLHIASGLGGWTRTDENHLELLDALDRIRKQIHDNTPI
ncbi:hypothetical protein [Streptomyces sp. NPDC088757]|uniref:hypothetical protein n=1 Tax=Streptomyces sp. NPDC088757 TaxID=3365889 RepID=UPI003830369F